MVLLPQPGLPCISTSSHALDLGAMELPDNRGDALGGGSVAGSNPVGLSLQCNGYGSHARTNMMQAAAAAETNSHPVHIPPYCHQTQLQGS